MNVVPWLLAGLVATLSALLWAESRRSRIGIWATKPVASAAFVALALALGAARTTYGQVVLVALLLSWIGDVLLIPTDQRAFRAGLVVFLVAHIAFVTAFVRLGIAPAWVAGAAAVLAPLGLFIGRSLLPRVPGALRAPVVAYIVVISTMVALAAGAVGAGASRLVIGGAGLFYVSDLAVARDRFVESGFPNRLVGLPLYYGAQALFALSTAAV